MKITPIGDNPLIGTLKPDKSQAGSASNPFTSVIDSAQSSQKNADDLMAKMIKGEQ
jgi:flagellar hook-basal body complex protein FliE